MNKTALKTFATEARKELLERIKTKAIQLGITEELIEKADISSSNTIYINGKQLVEHEINQRNKLINRIQEIGFDRVIDEVAYTWFNRFTALRFMEVNDYLPTRTRVLSSEGTRNGEPDMMKEALTLNLDLDKELVYELMMNNETDELFKYLIKAHCNDLNRYMPFMFETIEDYTAILFPEGLLAPDSFLRRMTDTEVIAEDNWENIEVIGWLYQYYIAEEKDEVFANLKKRIKISKETLPAATQLFTPNWIVRYMVENSLGRIWLESNPESKLKSNWIYYLEEVEQDESVLKQLDSIRYKDVNIEEITFLDPCCGSGHILTYAFDVFYDMYLEKGYIEHEIPKLILEKNLFGLDVDNRAVQLATFAVMMKAREKSSRVFRQGIRPNITAIQESNWLTDEIILNIAKTDNGITEMLNAVRDVFIDSKEYGSLLKVQQLNYEQLEIHIQEYINEESDLIEMIDKKTIEERVPLLMLQSKILSGKFDVVCTNPPYMGAGNMGDKLKKYVQKNYEKSKADLCAAFIESGTSQTKENGFSSLVTMHSWFFLSSFESIRKDILSKYTITSILHLGMEAFDGIIGKVVQTAAFVLRNKFIGEHKPVGVDLLEFYDGRKNEKEAQFFNLMNRFSKRKQNDYSKIPGSPIAYSVSDSLLSIFSENETISNEFEVRNGITTGENEKFIRNWYEVDFSNKRKWFPCNKGGSFRRWYGNIDYLIDWENNGYSLKAFKDNSGKNRATLRSIEYNFIEAITMSRITSAGTSYRWLPEGFITEGASNNIYFTKKNNKDEALILLGFLNTKLGDFIMGIYNPTINVMPNDIRNLPLKFGEDKIVDIVKENITLCKTDWNDFETSWNFEKHPLIQWETSTRKIGDTFEKWGNFTEHQFALLKNNEEELNRIFIDLYHLQKELSPEVGDKDITIRKADRERDIKSFISYAIGCSFGRYSLDEDGLIYAGGEFDSTHYKTYKVDEDNILPILPGAYFEDDIVSRFVEFVRVTFGEESLSENLDFVADAIKRRKNETAKETLRRYFMNDFYKDHVQIYKKRPIYWLFTSGKEKAFNCLIYMHRYDKSTLSRIRTDYLHEYQVRLDSEKADLMEKIDGDSTTKEINDAKRELKSLDKKIDELKKYDEVLHHMADMQIEIDLDDGVKVNYEKFKGLVGKI